MGLPWTCLVPKSWTGCPPNLARFVPGQGKDRQTHARINGLEPTIQLTNRTSD